MRTSELPTKEEVFGSMVLGPMVRVPTDDRHFGIRRHAPVEGYSISPPASSEKLAWAGGLFDGEGCFDFQLYKQKYPRIQARVTNTDRSLLAKLKAIVKVGNIQGPYERANVKPVSQFQVGALEDLQEFSKQLWPYIGTAKRKQFRECAARYNQYRPDSPLTIPPLSVYLGHKFERRDLGEEIQVALEALGLQVFNPFHRPEQNTYDTIARTTGDYSPVAEEIVTKDLSLIDRADAVVALLAPNAIGTVMEIFYANHVRQIPVFTWITYSMPYRHPWITHYSQDFTDRALFMGAIEQWAGGAYVG